MGEMNSINEYILWEGFYSGYQFCKIKFENIQLRHFYSDTVYLLCKVDEVKF